jgi:hypothetical protein
LRRKHTATKKEKAISKKRLPSPEEEFGSLKHLFPDKTAKELVEECRREDYKRDKRLLKMAERSKSSKQKTNKEKS